MKIIPTTLAALLIGTAAAQAGPDEVAKWLIQDPASMIDLGVLRIDLALSNGSGAPGGRATYDWDKNRFTITGSAGQVESADKAEKACEEWVNSVRVAAFIDTSTGNPYLGKASLFAELFSHSGFERTNAPADLYTTIDKMIELRCYGSFKLDGDLKIIEANAPLLGTGYSLKKD